jgi:spoIIIJ-associated protein
MGLAFPVTVDETEEAITFNIKGDGSGLLIGKGGQTLDAIQYILNKAVGKSGRDKRMIVLDTEGYRDRRDEYLIALAEKLGQKVKKSKKPVTINHLSARDRRVIHLAFKSDETITTKSRGEGIYRKIIILSGKKE